MGDKFNPKEDSSHLQHLDANNLYGWSMIQKLPTGEFSGSILVNSDLIILISMRIARMRVIC